MAQTPQGFRYSVLKEAFDEAVADGFVVPTRPSLVERSGKKWPWSWVRRKNIKITTPADMELAEFYFEEINSSRTNVERAGCALCFLRANDQRRTTNDQRQEYENWNLE